MASSELTLYDQEAGTIVHTHLRTPAGSESVPVSLWEKVTPGSQCLMWSRNLGGLLQEPFCRNPFDTDGDWLSIPPVLLWGQSQALRWLSLHGLWPSLKCAGEEEGTIVCGLPRRAWHADGHSPSFQTICHWRITASAWECVLSKVAQMSLGGQWALLLPQLPWPCPCGAGWFVWEEHTFTLKPNG